jgi:hypothetical protein
MNTSKGLLLSDKPRPASLNAVLSDRPAAYKMITFLLYLQKNKSYFNDLLLTSKPSFYPN